MAFDPKEVFKKANADIASLYGKQYTESQIISKLKENLEKGVISVPVYLESIDNLEFISKGRRGQIGEIREWQGKRFQKQATGKWLEISEHGKTKQEHLDELKKPIFSHVAKTHKQLASKLSDKEHSDKEIGIEEKKESSEKSIGTTKSGKRVFNNSSHKGHDGFTKEDHLDAAQLHREKMDEANKNNEGHKYHYHMSHRDTHKELANKAKDGSKDLEVSDLMDDSTKEELKASLKTFKDVKSGFDMPKFGGNNPEHMAFMYGRHQLPKEVAIDNAKKFLESIFKFRAQNKPEGTFDEKTFSASRLSDPNQAAILHGVPKLANKLHNMGFDKEVKKYYGDKVESRIKANNLYKDLKQSPIVGGSYNQPADLSKFESLVELFLKTDDKSINKVKR